MTYNPDQVWDWMRKQVERAKPEPRLSPETARRLLLGTLGRFQPKPRKS